MDKFKYEKQSNTIFMRFGNGTLSELVKFIMDQFADYNIDLGDVLDEVLHPRDAEG